MAEDLKSKALLVLILNILIPGVGGLIYAGTLDDEEQAKKVKTMAIIQLVLYIVGWVTTWLCIGAILIPVAWIWALIDGIKFYKELNARAAAG